MTDRQSMEAAISQPRKTGHKQTAEHVRKRIRTGTSHHAWKASDVSEKGGRTRALRMYGVIGGCVRCGAAKAERHHADGNTANNSAENIVVVCRRCHMELDGRLQAFALNASNGTWKRRNKKDKSHD